MRAATAALALVAALVLPTAAHGQAQPTPAAAPPQAQSAAPAQAPSTPQAAQLDSEIGVSLTAIRRQLRLAQSTPAPKGQLRYEFHVEVTGKEPKVDFFRDFVLAKDSGVPYGAPTHYELLNSAAPFPFRFYGGFDLLNRKK